MLDIKLIREDPKLVKDSLKKRAISESILDELLSLDNEWKQLKKETDELRARRNKISQEINLAKKNKEQIDNLIKEAKSIPKLLQEKENNLSKTEKKRISLWKNIPNILDKSVPKGNKNKILKKFGRIKNKKLEKGHAEVLQELDLIDTEKASEVSGSRFYYLKNELVKLNFAVIQFALDFLLKKRFKLIQTTYILNR